MKSLFLLFFLLTSFASSQTIAQNNKTNSTLIDQLSLIWPEDGGFVENSNYYNPGFFIKWSGLPKDSINIFYSLNDGADWLEAELSSSNTEDFSAYWLLPDTVDVECKIKIVEAADSLNFDENQTPFIIYSPDYEFIAINEILMWESNNGNGSHDYRTDAWGLFWPGGLNSTIGATFYDGLWWSSLLSNEKNANGSYYSRCGLRPGIIQSNGYPSDPTDSLYKIWKIRKNWEILPPGPERDEYEYNYNNWPAEIGAPWVDVNGDGVFTRGVDLPKFVGDETLWFVSNDLDAPKCFSVFGSPPLGLEFQVTTWGYTAEGLKDVVFKKYKVINKKSNTINDLVFGFWSDDDLGFANDDYPGCDSLLNLGYIFNGDNDDNGYYGAAPPAIGRMVIQAPIVPAAQTDSARFGEGWRKGFNNLRMSAYSPGFKNSGGLPQDPTMGISGTNELYYLLRGLGNSGDSIINPHTGLGTTFPLNGDPESGTGWYCGSGWPGGPSPRDVRSIVPSGPFIMAPGDTNEFAIAVFLQKGSDNLNSVTKLKQYAAYLQQWYNTSLVEVGESNDLLPDKFFLFQNYPNPFNPATTIRYELSQRSYVELKVFDILGRETAVLINSEQSEGKYNIEFNAEGLASGIYFYQLIAGDYSSVKKMILLK